MISVIESGGEGMAHKTRIITGYCPHVDGTHSIKATYEIFHCSMDPMPHEKCVNLFCKYKTFKSCKVEECPLKKEADSYNF